MRQTRGSPVFASAGPCVSRQPTLDGAAPSGQQVPADAALVASLEDIQARHDGAVAKRNPRATDRANEARRILDGVKAKAIPYGLDAKAIEEMLEISRSCGYGLNDSRMMPEMAGIAVPICTSDGRAIGSMGIAAIAKRLEPARRADIVAWIRKEVARLETSLAPLLGPIAGASGRGLISRSATS